MRDDRAGRDRAVGAAALDDLGVLEERLELADAALHLALLVLGGVVVAVLGEVAELAGRLDLAGDLDPAAGGEVLVLGLQPLVRGAGELRASSDMRDAGYRRRLTDRSADRRHLPAMSAPALAAVIIIP